MAEMRGSHRLKEGGAGGDKTESTHIAERNDCESGEPAYNPTKISKKNLPKTREEMDGWMQTTRSALLDYLTWCRSMAHEQPGSVRIEDMNLAIDDEWLNWANKADIQTGEIHDEVERNRMFDAMQPLWDTLSNFHASSGKEDRHSLYTDAQSYWEDFHYYQNEWNRRRCGQNHQGSAWLHQLIALYDKFGIGARDDVPDALKANEVHIFPQGVRGSRTNPSSMRKLHLQTKYPESALRLDHRNIELKRKQVNEWRRTRDNFKPNELPDSLPVVKYYSAANAREWRDHTSKEPPTSWESQNWGEAVGSAERMPLFAYPHDRKRYKTKSVKSLVRTFVWKSGKAAGKALTNTSEGQEQFQGHYVDKLRFENHFVLDENDQRIEIWPTKKEKQDHHNLTHDHYSGTQQSPGPVLYRIPKEPNRTQGPGRREVAESRVAVGKAKDWRKKEATEDDDRDAEFSDDEAVNNEPSDSAGDKGSDPGGEESNDDSDDERDVFTLAYQGGPLPEMRPDGLSGHGGSDPDGKDNDEDSNDNEDHEYSDDHGNGGNATGQTGNGRSDSGDADQDRTSRAASKPVSKPTATGDGERVSLHKPSPKAPTETFEAIPGEDDWDIATYIHTFPNGTTFTQRTRVPAYKPDVRPSMERNPPRKIYPKTGVIPANVKRTIPWRKDNKSDAANGRWSSGNDEWFPTVILRTFRVDNNGYFGCSINPHFDAIMMNGFRHEDIAAFNRSFQQVIRRSDRDAKAKLEAGSFGPWTDGEMNLVREYSRQMILRDGLVQWFDDWKGTHLGELHRRINAHRETNEENKKPRSHDSVRSKLDRQYADLFTRAAELKARQARGETLTDDELKPKDVLSEVVITVTKARTLTKTAEKTVTKSGSKVATGTKAVRKPGPPTKRKRDDTELSTHTGTVEDQEGSDTTDTEVPKKKKKGKKDR